MRTDRSDELATWLKTVAAPGRSHLRQAAGAQVLETVFTIAQWAGLAWVVQRMVDGQTHAVWFPLSLMFAGGLLAAAAAWTSAGFQASGGQQISGAIRRSLVACVLPAGPRRGNPEAATAAMASIELADDVADHHAQALPQRMSAPVSMALVLLVTALLQWPAAVVLLLASLLMPLNMRLAGTFAKEGAAERLAASTGLAAVVLDSFRGLRTLQSIGAVTRRRTQLLTAAERLNETTMAVVRRTFLSGSVMEVLITFSIATDATYIGLSLLGYLRLGGAPPVTLFSGLLVLLLCPMYFVPVRATAAAYHSGERAAAAAPTIRSHLDQPAVSAGPGPETAVTGPIRVELAGTEFRFPRAGGALIRGVELTFAAGEWTALTGISGAGKTTLLSLIAGARQPTAGTIQWVTTRGTVAPRLGGCAWIGQQTVILPGSIGENIRIGSPSADLADVLQAVAAAGLADLVARLPRGLDTELGENGWGISTGEARRIAIARSFLRNTGLWVLDEPTAHLDRDAEARVIAALRVATRGRTVIVATHSPPLARCADTLFTVTDGTVHPVREVIAT